MPWWCLQRGRPRPRGGVHTEPPHPLHGLVPSPEHQQEENIPGSYPGILSSQGRRRVRYDLVTKNNNNDTCSQDDFPEHPELASAWFLLPGSSPGSCPPHPAALVLSVDVLFQSPFPGRLLQRANPPIFPCSPFHCLLMSPRDTGFVCFIPCCVSSA